MNSKAGVSMPELAISIVVFSVIGLAVNSLFTAAFQAQLTQRGYAKMESISMNFLESFRADSRSAVFVQLNPTPPGLGTACSLSGVNSVSGNAGTGNSLTLFYDAANTSSCVRYDVDTVTGTLSRFATIDPRTREALVSPLTTVYVAPTRPGTENLIATCRDLDTAGQAVGAPVPCFRFSKQFQQDTTNTLGSVSVGGNNAFDVRVGVSNIRITSPNGTIVQLPVDAFGQPGFNIRGISYSIAGSRVFQ